MLTSTAKEAPQGKFWLCNEEAKRGDVPIPTARAELMPYRVQAQFSGFCVFVISLL